MRMEVLPCVPDCSKDIQQQTRQLGLQFSNSNYYPPQEASATSSAWGCAALGNGDLSTADYVFFAGQYSWQCFRLVEVCARVSDRQDSDDRRSCSLCCHCHAVFMCHCCEVRGVYPARIMATFTIIPSQRSQIVVKRYNTVCLSISLWKLPMYDVAGLLGSV